MANQPTTLEELMNKLPPTVQKMILDKYQGKQKGAAFVAGVVIEVNRTMTDAVIKILEDQNIKLDSMEDNIQWLMGQFTEMDGKKGAVAQLQDDVAHISKGVNEIKGLLEKRETNNN